MGEPESQARPPAVHVSRGILSMAPGGLGLQTPPLEGEGALAGVPASPLPHTPSDLQEQLLISSPNWKARRQEGAS